MLPTWNDGMLESWNNGQKIDIVSIVPPLHHSIIPVFHYSNRTTLSLDSEALEGRLSTGCERSELSSGFGSAASTFEINFSSFHASLYEQLPSLTSTSFLDGIMMTLCSWNPSARYASFGMEGQRRLAGFDADPAFSQNKAPYSP